MYLPEAADEGETRNTHTTRGPDYGNQQCNMLHSHEFLNKIKLDNNPIPVPFSSGANNTEPVI